MFLHICCDIVCWFAKKDSLLEPNIVWGWTGWVALVKPCCSRACVCLTVVCPCEQGAARATASTRARVSWPRTGPSSAAACPSSPAASARWTSATTAVTASASPATGSPPPGTSPAGRSPHQPDLHPTVLIFPAVLTLSLCFFFLSPAVQMEKFNPAVTHVKLMNTVQMASAL